MTVLDLSPCKTGIVLSNEKVGLSWRTKFSLDVIDKTNSSTKIIIPSDIVSINMSFFFGLFGDSIRILGEDLFNEKYVFDCDDLFKGIIKDYVKLISRRFTYEK